VAEGLGTEASDDGLGWLEDLPENGKAFMASFSDKFGFDKASPEDNSYAPPPPSMVEAEMASIAFEAIPLPWLLTARANISLLVTA
jgi:hypothetical protein